MAAKDLLLAAVARSNVTPVAMPFLPELHEKIYVRVLTAGERHLYGSVALDASSEKQFISDYEIAAICACEADGTPMFHIREPSGRITISPEDVARLQQVDGRAIHAIAMKALEVSGLDQDSKERAKKNSDLATSESSSSDSP